MVVQVAVPPGKAAVIIVSNNLKVFQLRHKVSKYSFYNDCLWLILVITAESFRHILIILDYKNFFNS